MLGSWNACWTGLAFYVLAVTANHPMLMSEGIAVVWPANALLVVVLLRVPPRRWAGHGLAVLCAEVAADLPWFGLKPALMFGGVNLSEGLLVTALLQWLLPERLSFDRPQHVKVFGVVLGLICALTALGGAAVNRYVVGGPEQDSFWVYWQIWWFGDSVGLLMVVPMLQAWWPQADPARPAPGPRAPLQLPLVALLLCLLMGAGDLLDEHAALVAPLLLLSYSIWLATQVDLRSLTLTGVLLGFCLIVLTVRGQGPFADLHTTMTVLRLQAFLFTLCLTSLGLWTLLQERALDHAQQHLLQRAIEALGEGVVLADARQPELPVLYVNPKFEQMTGYSAAEVLGRSSRLLLRGEQDQPGLDTLRQALQDGTPAQVLLRNHHKDGNLFVSELTVAPVFDEHQQLSAFVGVQRDVTALHQSQEELCRTRDQLAGINLDLAARIADRVRELEQLNVLLGEQAHTDPLTGVANRRHFRDLTLREMARSDRSGHAMCLAMFDIDHFKAVNDEHGHEAGDQVLVGMTRTVKTLLRSGDTLARLGGEEFGLLLPETRLAEALIVAERLRLAVVDLQMPYEGVLLRVTISIGLVQHVPSESLDALLKQADRRMYEAKQRGRNQVVT